MVHLESLPVGATVLSESPDPWASLARSWREYYDSLPPGERSRLRCFCGHQAPFLIDAIDDRPVQAFCMLRDPVERVLSSYRFMLAGAARSPRSSLEGRVLGAVRERGWGIRELYLELGGAADYRSKLEGVDQRVVDALVMTFFDGQMRFILLATHGPSEIPLASGGEGLSAYRDSAYETLSERYVVGTQDRFSQSVRLFAESFGWRRVFEPRVNVGRRGGSREARIDDETLGLIRAYNQVDGELHRHYSQRLSVLPTIGRVTALRARGRRSAKRARARVGRWRSPPPRTR